MAHGEDLIDFDLIESHKENIQALPSGRSAKALATVLSPLAISSPLVANDGNAAKRAAFEREIVAIDDSDDPLDIYDRYIKWTLDAFPSAQATPQSQLLPLLERATKAFLAATHYHNDPRYLRWWLHYIRFFSDAPRETFAYLARRGIGETLALYYEEFAAWLEGQGRVAQAQEIYELGISKGARPTERLHRKFVEFQMRCAATLLAQAAPSSPALPAVRPALAAKLDPFAASSPAPAQVDPQAAARAAEGRAAGKKQKMSIFADTTSGPTPAGVTAGKGWDTIGTIAERKKENMIAARPWAGEIMKSSGIQAPPVPKMSIFKDQNLQAVANERIHAASSRDPSFYDQVTLNPRSGRNERIVACLEAVYADSGEAGPEFCFEELRAARRGWLDRNWRAPKKSRSRRSSPSQPQSIRHPPQVDHDLEIDTFSATFHNDLRIQDGEVASDAAAFSSHSHAETLEPQREPYAIPPEPQSIRKAELEAPHSGMEKSKTFLVHLHDENDDVDGPSHRPHVNQSAIDKRLQREERANRTRRIKVREVKEETQTVQTNLASPRGPRLRKKKSAEPTMTIHSKAAADDIYAIFNQALPPTKSTAVADEDDEESIDGDDYTSAGESTGTGRISGTTSEFGDETQPDLTEAHSISAEDTTLGDEATSTGYSASTEDRVGDDEEEADDVDDEDDSHVPRTQPASSGGIMDGVSDANDDHENGGPRDLRSEPPVPEGLLDALDAFEDVVTPTSPPSYLTAHSMPESFEPPMTEPRNGRLLQRQGDRKLPFMTPIVEQTESSLGTLTAHRQKDYFNSRTPCAKNRRKTPTIHEDDAGDEVWSSPFEDVLKEVVNHNEKLPQPQLVAPKAREKSDDGVIIKDLVCNPMDDAIHAAILRESRPALSSWPGFFDFRNDSYDRKTDIRRYFLPPPDSSYTIRRELGTGAFAPVYLAERTEPQKRDDETALCAIKMEEPPSAWEYHILELAHHRLLRSAGRVAGSLIRAQALYLFADASYLILDYVQHGTLLDVVNALVADAAAGGGGTAGPGIDEALAMCFMVELLRVVEALHSVGLIHGDMKADNVLLRLPAQLQAPPLGSYSSIGADGWAERGITLIDLGRGIDVRAFTPQAKFIADWNAGSGECSEMREARPWTYQADMWGLAGVAHTLLYGRYIDTIGEKGGLGATTRHRLKEPLKRYWQTGIWTPFFDLALNSSSVAASTEASKALPALQGMKDVRMKMEAWLEGSANDRVRSAWRRLEVIKTVVVNYSACASRFCCVSSQSESTNKDTHEVLSREISPHSRKRLRPEADSCSGDLQSLTESRRHFPLGRCDCAANLRGVARGTANMTDKVPNEPPPTYAHATGSSTSSSAPRQSSSHLTVGNGIPPEVRRSMEDEHRELPRGWIRQYDAKSSHHFYVDTTKKPPRSIWHHPYDDDSFLAEQTPEERQRITDLHKGPTQADIIAEMTDEDDQDEEHHDTHKTASSSTSHVKSNTQPSEPKKLGRKLKDKLTGKTHEEREAERAHRAKVEQESYARHQHIRGCMDRAVATGQPQFMGTDKDGHDVYIEPPPDRERIWWCLRGPSELQSVRARESVCAGAVSEPECEVRADASRRAMAMDGRMGMAMEEESMQLHLHWRLMYGRATWAKHDRSDAKTASALPHNSTFIIPIDIGAHSRPTKSNHEHTTS
ncbi:hypothetical protein MRB53_042361 [Persea americana]|nr:hypothetical protein MRB53_042361 [Persea americana]